MAPSGPEAEVRQILDRLLRDAGWTTSEIGEEQNLRSGRLDYRLGNLCILEAKKPVEPDQPAVLKMHLQQAQRYARSVEEIPFLMISDGELHYIQDRRSGRIERLFAIPTRQQLTALKGDESLLIDGYIVTNELHFSKFRGIPFRVPAIERQLKIAAQIDEQVSAYERVKVINEQAESTMRIIVGELFASAE
jgi:hypothetical protein